MENRWRVALWLLLAFGLYVRLSHASVGLPYLFRWDEPLVVNSGLWALGHAWDPFTFRYGSVPIYLSALASIAAFLVEMATGSVSSFAQFTDAGLPLSNVVGQTTNAPLAFWYSRVLFATISMGGAWLAFRTARDMGSSARAAVLAALALTLSPIHVRSTLLATVDGIGMTLVATALAVSLWMIQQRRVTRNALLFAGITSGLAVATKFALLWTPLLPLMALLLTPRDLRQRRTDIGVLAITVLGTFVLCQPYAVLNMGRFLAGVGFEVSHYAFMGHPGQDGPSGFAQLGQIGQALLYGFGAPWLSVIVLALSVVGAAVSVARHWRASVILLGWIGLQIYVLTQQVVFFERSLLPVLPALVVLAALGTDTLLGLARRAGTRHQAADRLLVAAVGLAFLPAAAGEWRDAQAAWNVRDTRSLATEWLVQRVQPGEQVVISNQLPFDLTELRQHRIAFRIVDPVATPCWFSRDPYAFYVTSEARGPALDAPVLVAFEGRSVTLDEPLFSPAVQILGRTRSQCDLPEPKAPAWQPMLPEIGGAGYDPSPRYRGADYALLGYDGWVKFPNVAAAEGVLSVQIEARSTRESAVPAYALVRVTRADTLELVGWHFMALETSRSTQELTFRVPAGEFFVVVSQPYELERGITEPYLVELGAVRVRHHPR